MQGERDDAKRQVFGCKIGGKGHAGDAGSAGSAGRGDSAGNARIAGPANLRGVVRVGVQFFGLVEAAAAGWESADRSDVGVDVWIGVDA